VENIAGGLQEFQPSCSCKGNPSAPNTRFFESTGAGYAGIISQEGLRAGQN